MSYPKKFRPIIDALARAFPNLDRHHERTPENWAALIDDRTLYHKSNIRRVIDAEGKLRALREALLSVIEDR